MQDDGVASRVRSWRAVDAAELASIREAGRFLHPPGYTVKYFATTAESATRFGQAAEARWGGGPYALVATSIPRHRVEPAMIVEVDPGLGGIVAVVIPTELLSHLQAPKMQGMIEPGRTADGGSFG